MGKGSGRRPAAVSEAEQDARWAATFGLPAGKVALIDPSSPVGWIVAPGWRCDHHGDPLACDADCIGGVDTGDQGPQIADARA